MLISEIFHSIQGEGSLTGVPSVFIRTTGCNLRCTWCDTPYTSWEPQGTDIDIAQIVADVKQHDTRFVVITGGEPMIAPHIGELCHALAEQNYHITMETAATRFTPVPMNLASLSPKLANSTPHQRENGRFVQMHENARINLNVIRAFMDHADYQLKFVVAEESDMQEIDQLLDQVGHVEREKVMLMPEGTSQNELDRRGTWVADICKQRGFRFCPRLHISLYGNTPGT